MSTRELQHTPHRSSARPISRSSSLTLRVTMVVSGRGPRNGNPTCQRGSYSTRPIAHQPRPTSRSSSLTHRVTMIVSCRRPRNGNPTCQRGSYRTRSIAHSPRPTSRCFLTDASRYQCLTDVSGYHCMANGHCTSSGTRSVNEPLVTRRVNEGATVHAPSLIRHSRHPDPLR